MAILECKGLCKSYGAEPALDRVDLSVEPGHIVGLLGPNGSGKSTLIKLANGLLTPDAGEILIDGKAPCRETKKIVSYLPERTYFADWMTALQLLAFFGDFYDDFDRDAAVQMMQRLGIQPKQQIKQMSKGTREKVQLILVMSRKAKLYLLDEPIGGRRRPCDARFHSQHHYQQLQPRGRRRHLHAPDRGRGEHPRRRGVSQPRPSAAAVVGRRAARQGGQIGGRCVSGGIQMLGKLLKQDFRATARIMLPLYAAVPVLGLFTNLITRLCENQNGFLIRAIGALVSFVFSLSLIAAVVTTVVLMILRFYRNLMTDEGYLMFTLPVSTTELIFSKLIVSIVWFLGTFAVDALGLLLSGTLGGYEDIVRFRFAFTFGAPYSMPTITQAQAGWLTVGVVVLVVLCGLALCLMTYAAMAIGQSFKKNKGLMSVVFFFVLWIGTRLLLALIFGAFYGSATSAVNTMTVLQALWTVLGCACVGALAFCAGFFFLTHGMLRKHLNLQ